MTRALHTLLAHAERQRDTALTELLQAEDALRRLQLQADQLHAYRDEYRQRHPAQGGRTASIELLRCHELFMQRLDQALLQQQRQVEAGGARSATLRGTLLALETRVAGVRKLIERRGEQALVAGARLEQRRSDDAVQSRRRDDGASAAGWRLGTEHAPLTL